ncbi:TPA: gp53-like domain-containing protein [Enterobacter roggenkampii]
MRPLMPPVQTPDNLFHDGNPLTGELGTIVDAEHLNNEQAAIRDTQSELIAILTAAAMEPASTAGQLLAALNKLYAPFNDTLGALSTLVGGANKLPYFTAADAAALTALSSIGRDIIGKATVADVLTYLGFVGSLTSPGYAVIPLGTKKLVIQWGTVTVPTAGSASATYLLALDLGLAQFCTPIDVSSINNYRVGVATSTKTSITLASTNTQSVTGVMWLSIGTIN